MGRMTEIPYITATFERELDEIEGTEALDTLERLCEELGGVTIHKSAEDPSLRYHFIAPGTIIHNSITDERMLRTDMMYATGYANEEFISALKDHYEQEPEIKELTGHNNA